MYYVNLLLYLQGLIPGVFDLGVMGKHTREKRAVANHCHDLSDRPAIESDTVQFKMDGQVQK